MRNQTDLSNPSGAVEQLALPPQLRRVLIAVAATGGVLVLLFTPVFGLRFAASVAVGAAVAVANFWILVRAVRAYFGGTGGAGWGLFVVLKFSFVVGGLYLLFRSGFVQGLPLAVGLGSLPIGIVLAELVAPLAVKEG